MTQIVEDNSSQHINVLYADTGFGKVPYILVCCHHYMQEREYLLEVVRGFSGW
jgi:hypothetical protein